jgi:hypothetical protein
MFAIRLHSPQGMSDVDQIKKLKHLAQTAIYTEAFRDIQPTDLPQYVLAFRYEINPVNYPQFIILGLLQGFDAQWIDRHDNIGMSWMMDDIYSNFNPDAYGRSLPPSLENWTDRNERLGLVVYTSRMDSNDNKYGRNMAVAYAPTVGGYQAAAELVNQLKGRIIQLCSGLSVTLECFPPRDSSKSNRKKTDNIVTFARTSILANRKICNTNYKVVTLSGLTSALKDPKERLNMLVNYRHLTGIVGTTTKLPKSPNSFAIGYTAKLVLNRGTNVVGREESFFRKLYQQVMPQLFPEAVEDDQANQDDFTVVSHKNKSAKKLNTSTSLKDTVNMLSTHIKSSVDQNANCYMVYGGRGGRRSVGVYDVYNDGVIGAKYLTHGVSGAMIKGYENKNEAWAELEKRFGVYDEESLYEFHANIPHTEGNMDPMHTDLDGPHAHRFGAENYTYTEADSVELLLRRMEATKRITGSENGLMNQRRFYYASLFDADAFRAQQETNRNTPQKNGNTESNSTSYQDSSANDPNKAPYNASNSTGNHGPDQEDEIEDFEFSQEEDLTNQEMSNLDNSPAPDDTPDNTSTTSKRSGSPPKKRKVEEEGPPHPVLNKPSSYSIYDTTLVAISLPDVATLHDSLLYLHGFNPGLGGWWQGQAKLGHYSKFPDCQVLFLQCPKNIAHSLREFIHRNKFFKKWQIFSAYVTSEALTTYFEPDNCLETLAHDPLIQCVKATVHPKHEIELVSLLASNHSSTGQTVFEHYLKNWKTEAITDNSKPLNSDWRVPSSTTSFQPSEWIPPPRDGYIDPESFQGAAASF